MKFGLTTFLRSRVQSAFSYACENLISSTRSVVSRTGRQLYERISPIRGRGKSILPVLDKWIKEGNSAEREDLQFIIQQLNFDQRFKHALEVYWWMTEKRSIVPSTEDINLRLKFEYDVYGLVAAEKYFERIPEQHKTHMVHNFLLGCYCQNKSIEKAEILMQKIRDLGYNHSTSYTMLMRLYSQVGQYENLELLVQEMEQKNIVFNEFTYIVLLKAYLAASDSDSTDKIVKKMESDPRVAIDTEAYTTAASLYMRVGIHEKALEMLGNLEGLAPMTPITGKSNPYDFMIELYGQMGKKDDVCRIWNLYKKEDKIPNQGYIRMIAALMRFNELEEVVKIVEEWESNTISYDFRVLNLLIEMYCKKGEIQKAEDSLNSGIARGGEPRWNTWLILAGAYVKHNQYGKMMEALETAKSVCPNDSKSAKDMIVRCLDIIRREGNIERAKAKDLIKLAKVKGFYDRKDGLVILDFVNAA